MDEKQPMDKKKVIMLVVFFLLFYLVKTYIWDVYIVNPTPWDALSEEEDGSGNLYGIDDDHILAAYTSGRDYNVYALSQGYWGWSISDQTAILAPDDEPFRVEKKTLHFKGEEDMDIILIASADEADYKVDSYVAQDENGQEIDHFNGIHNSEGDSYLYYDYSEEPLKGDITVQAFEEDGNLLYEVE